MPDREADLVQSQPTSMSRRFWDLDWARVLPWTFDDVHVELVSFDEALPFMKQHYGTIFGAEAAKPRFFASPMNEAKHRFCSEADVLVFRHEERIVGLLLAHPQDWSTYYMRSVAVLPEYRERRLLTRFMERSYEPLREVGVERIEGECSPANAPMMRMLVGQGFLVTSTSNSERWGSLIRFTKFLNEDAEGIFLRQFNSVTPKKRAPSPTEERSTS